MAKRLLGHTMNSNTIFPIVINLCFLALVICSSCNSGNLSNGQSYHKLYPIREGNAWGWMDSVGNIVVAPEEGYSKASSFVDGLGYLRKGSEKYAALYNSRLEKVWEDDQVIRISILRGGYAHALIKDDGMQKYYSLLLDREGREIYRKEGFTTGPTAQENGLLIYDFTGFTVKDMTGRDIIPEGLEPVRCLRNSFAFGPDWVNRRVYEGHFIVRDRNYRYAIADTSGKVSPLRFKDCGCFRYGRAPAMDSTTHLYGYIDGHGEWIIPPTYRRALEFSEGLAAVQSAPNYSWGYIDTLGRMVLDFQYEYAFSFSQGLAYVRKTLHEAAYIDHQGMDRIPVKEEFAILETQCAFHHGLGLTATGKEEFAIVDLNGKAIVSNLGRYDITELWWDENLIALQNGWMNHQGHYVWKNLGGRIFWW